MTKLIRNIFLTLLTFTAIPSFTHDYYAIPSGWEKVCEFDSSSSLELKSSKNQLYFHNIGKYSQDGGKTFRKIKLNRNNPELKLCFIKDKFNIFNYCFNTKDSTYNNTLKFDLTNYYDTILKNDKVNIIWDIPDKHLYYSYKYETIISIYQIGHHFGDEHICTISRDFGETWTSIKGIPKNSYSLYTFIFDYTNPQKWVFKLDAFSAIMGTGSLGYFVTEDNGYSFNDINIENIPSYINKEFNSYLSMTTFGSRLYFSNSKNDNQSLEIFNQLVISNVFDKNMKTVLSLDSIVADYSKLNTVVENSVNFSNIYFYTKDKGMLFQTIDQAKYINKDTTSVKLMYLDCANQKVNVWQDFEIPLIPNEKNYSLPRILDYDRETGFVYVELSQPIAGLQKRVVIRKQIGTANSIETEREQTETITVNDGRVLISKQFENPEILVLDLLGKKVDFNVLSISPLTLQLTNQTNGIYFLQIKDNLKQNNYKLMVRE